MIRWCVTLALLLCVALAGGARADCQAPAARGDGWTVAAPEAVGFDGAILCATVERLRTWPDVNVHGVVVARYAGWCSSSISPAPTRSGAARRAR